MVIKAAVFLLVILQIARATLEVTIYPDEEFDNDIIYDQHHSTLDIRRTTFFNIDRTVSPNSDDDFMDDDAATIDVFAWKSNQRVVFTLTNPKDTH